MSTADFGTGRTATFAYDNLQRLTSETMAGLYTKSYTYRDISSTRTTTQIASQSYTGLCSGWSNRTASYTYDAMGNIATITGPYKNKNSVQRTYTYDAQNQLLSETIDGDTTSYTYDTAGNIRSVTGPGVTKTFTYDDTGDWKDLLTSVTINGETGQFTYESDGSGTIGNPTHYFNGDDYELTWKNGRQLASLTRAGRRAWYSYGADGIRTSKALMNGNNPPIMHYYTTQNGKIVREQWGSAQMDFVYDATGRPLALYYRVKLPNSNEYSGDSYYYETNQQGDVTGLYKITYDAATNSLSATRVASYEYDAWGNVTYSTGEMADINPLRYRGYYQDWESGYYYLQSRYYDPVIGRFVNADLPEYAALSVSSLASTNLFAYCNNNPTNHKDVNGEWTVGLFGTGNATVILGVSISIGVVIDDKGGMEIQWSYSEPWQEDARTVGAFSVGAGFALQITDADSVSDLHGSATAYGASGGAGPSVGVDVISFSKPNDPNGKINGIQISGGGGAGFDVHVSQTITKPLCKLPRMPRPRCIEVSRRKLRKTVLKYHKKSKRRIMNRRRY